MRITSLLLNQVWAYENISSYEGSNDKGSHIIIKFLFTEITRCLFARLFVDNWFTQGDGRMMMIITIILIIIIILQMI